MSLNTTRRTHYPPVDRVTRLDQRTRPTRHRHSHQDEDDMGVVETLQLRSGRKRHHDRDHAASPRRHAGAAGGGGASGRARRAARPSQHEHERQSFPTLSNGPDTSKGPVSYASVKSHHDVPDAIPPKDPSNLHVHTQRHASLSSGSSGSSYGGRKTRQRGSTASSNGSASSGDMTEDGSAGDGGGGGLLGKVKKMIS